MFTIEVEDSEATAQLERAARGLESPAPLMAAIANELVSQTEANFAAEGRPAWLGLKYPREDGGKILQRSGQLAASIQPFHTSDTAGIGTNKVYAPIQHLGGKTSPHVIRPKNKQALAFGGHVVKKVNHPGSEIPARPFLPIDENGNLQPEAVAGIMSVTNAYLRGIIGN